MNKEYIICAAIWFKDLPDHSLRCLNTVDKGFVVAGWRHGNVVETVKILSNLRTVKLSPDGVGETVQGFLTNTNRFVDRKEAGQIAYSSGQIDKPTDCLFSEDLY